MSYASVADYLPEGQDGRRALLDRGAELGRNTASTDYPNAVYRDRRQVELQAVQVFQSKEASWKKGSELNQREDERYDLNYWKHAVKRANAGIQGVYDPGYSNYAKFKGKNPKDLLTQFVTEEQNKVRRWDEQVDEARRLFVSAYAGAYLEYVQKEDARRAPPPPQPKPVPQPQPQPAAQPATPPATSPTGAVVIITRVDRSNPNEYVYYLELTDPDHFDGIEKTEWVVYFEGASVPDASTATTTSSYGASSTTPARGYASSSAAYEATRTTPQKPRKPLGSYLRKPK